MEELRREYCEGLAVDLEILRAAVDRLHDSSVATEVRELAHRLRGSGGAYGFPAISAAGAMLEDASTRDLSARLDDLMLAIQMARRETL